MKRSGLLITWTVALSVILLLGGQPAPALAHPPATAPTTLSAHLAFIQNVGQFPAEARFRARAEGYTLWLADDALWITTQEVRAQPQEGDAATQAPPAAGRRSPVADIQGVNVRLSFPDAGRGAQLVPLDRQEAPVSYLLGNDREQWRAAVPVWRAVRYLDLYPGVDLEVASEDGQLLLRLICNSDCASVLPAVRLRIEGGSELDVGKDVFLLSTSLGPIAIPPLVVDGATPDGQPAVDRLEDQAFEVTLPFSSTGPESTARSEGPNPRDNPDDLLFSTFVGGSVWDEGHAIAMDEDGNSYVTGYTSSTDFPVTPGAFDTSADQYSDVFVAKLNPLGTALLYATYLGGDYFEEGDAIAVDNGGHAIVTGYTHSTDFPTTPGAYDTTCGTDGNCNAGEGIPPDAFVVRLNADGTDLIYGTYLGASLSDHGYAIATDGEGNATVTGSTVSADFPTTPGAYDTSWNGTYDLFVARLNAAGTDLTYGTFIGGSDKDEAYALAVDGVGNTYLTGMTRSPNFPTTPGAFDTTCGTDGACNGLNEDAFALKLNATGTALDYSTFLGGQLYEQGEAIATDLAGSAYVAGYTVSNGFPTTPGAFDTGYSGSGDAFVTKLAPDGTELIYSTFLGSTGGEGAYGLGVDAAGFAHVTGGTNSEAFPTTPNAFDTSYGGGICGTPPYQSPCTDAFVTKLSPDGSSVAYGSYLGGSGFDYGFGIAVDRYNGDTNRVYVTGQAELDFPTTPDAFDPTPNGLADAFATSLATGAEPTMHVQAIFLGSLVRPGGLRIVLALVRIVDADGESLGGTTVKAEWTLPDGSTRVRQRDTVPLGVAWFAVGSVQSGTYEICVTDAYVSGYLYDSDQNLETCDSLLVP